MPLEADQIGRAQFVIAHGQTRSRATTGRHRFIAISLGVGLLAACGAPTTEDAADTGPTRADLIDQGEIMAQALCSGCHAIGTDGDSPHREAIELRRIGWNYPVEALAESFAEGIVVGHPDMPEWQFEPDEIEALLAYLESIQEPRNT